RFGFTEVLRSERSRNDGEVIGDFGVVEDSLVRLDPIIVENLRGERAIARRTEHLQGLLYRGRVILGQGTRIGPWIGQDFVLLVKSLCQAKSVFCRKPKTPVRLSLQTREVVKQR